MRWGNLLGLIINVLAPSAISSAANVAAAGAGALMLFVSTHPAIADGRTVAFVKGMAYGISAHCPNLPVDKSEVSRTKHIPGIRDGDVNEFISGMSYTSELLKTHSDACYSDDNSGCSCENICSLRPGTCYFVKEQAK